MPLWVVFVWVLMNAICFSGFNLVRRFSLLKSADVKKIRNPRGPVILRLGKTALLRPTEWVYSTHCPSLALFFFPAPTDKTRPPQRHICAALGGWECVTGSEIKVYFLLDFPLDSAGLCWQALAFHAVSEQRERQRDWVPCSYPASEPSLSMSAPSNGCRVKKIKNKADAWQTMHHGSFSDCISRYTTSFLWPRTLACKAQLWQPFGFPVATACTYCK